MITMFIINGSFKNYSLKVLKFFYDIAVKTLIL